MEDKSKGSVGLLKQALGIAERIQRLEADLAGLLKRIAAGSGSAGAARLVAGTRPRRKPRFSAAARARIAAAQKARWARVRKAKSGS